MNRYEDIINLPHHVSKTRPQMSMAERAAQFSPYAALTGYDAAIAETGRLTEERAAFDEHALDVLNWKFQLLADSLNSSPVVTILYFRSDERKDGGACVRISGIVKKIDNYTRAVIMQDGTSIPIDDILDFQGDLFAAI